MIDQELNTGQTTNTHEKLHRLTKEALVQQNKIGWDQTLRGRRSQKWAEAQTECEIRQDMHPTRKNWSTGIV